MPRRALPSTHLLARIREWFGLHQAELALYMGSSQTMVQAIESGQRRLNAELFAAVLPLARQLPPAAEAAPALPPLPPADPAELDFRRRVCQQQAERLGRELAQLQQQARVAQRWAEALPALLQATAPPTGQPDPDPERTAWVQGWLGRRARPLLPEAASRARLLRARLAGLAAEIADLEAAD